MDTHDAAQLHEHPQYLRGQLMAMQAALISLARITADAAEFRATCLPRLELLRTALLQHAVADEQIAGVDDFERWLMASFPPR